MKIGKRSPLRRYMMRSSILAKVIKDQLHAYSGMTQDLCFAELHSGGARPNTSFYRSEFPAYLKVIGRNAANQFESEHKLGSESAIFNAYNNALAAGLRSATAIAFKHTFEIALAYTEPLDGGPVDWAKAHILMLIHGLKHHVQDWIKNCCDTQASSNSEQDFESFIFWKEWRAPRFIRMKPSGNLPYDANSTWTRR